MHALAPITRLPYRPTTNLVDLPSVPVVYFVLQRGPSLLYIGKSRNLAKRWANNGKAHHRAAQLIHNDNYLFWHLVNPAYTDAQFDYIERNLIRRYQPLLNDTPLPRRAVVDTRPFAERQQRGRENIMRTLRECGNVQACIVAAEQAMDQQMVAATRWLRAYRNGLEDVLEQRQKQQAQLNTALSTIRVECARFLSSIRSVKKDA